MTTTRKKRKGGRPAKFDGRFVEQAKRLCMLGAIDKEIARFFDVSLSALNKWKSDHPEFMQALADGKAVADANVASRLYERAMGYTHPEEKIFCQNGKVTRAETLKHYPPDTTACIFWLKNRRPDLWRDRVEHTGKDGGPLAVSIVDPTRNAGADRHPAGESDAHRPWQAVESHGEQRRPGPMFTRRQRTLN